MYEFNKANLALQGGGGGGGGGGGVGGGGMGEGGGGRNGERKLPNGGVVNRGFTSDGGDMYIHARSDDDPDTSSSSNRNLPSPRRTTARETTTTLNDVEGSPAYRPPSTHYGRLKANSSFKRPDNENNNNQFKKQPRTQLAVPPCRPELPPRESNPPRRMQPSHIPYPDSGAEISPPISPGKYRSSNDLDHGPSITRSRYDAGDFDVSPTYKGMMTSEMAFSPDGGYSHKMNGGPHSPGVQLDSGSMEKISRV